MKDARTGNSAIEADEAVVYAETMGWRDAAWCCELDDRVGAHYPDVLLSLASCS